MASGNKSKGKEGAEAEEAAAAGKENRARGKGSERAPAAPKAPRKKRGSREPGKIAGIGPDVPKLADLETEKREREQFEQEVKRRPGQPTGYHPRFAEIAKAMCRLGASDADLAQEFEVKTQTIWLWRCKHQEFFDALTEGKHAFDERVERCLAIKACGYSVNVEKLFCYEGQIIRAETIEHYPPDPSAIKMWLTNRKPNEWRDKQELKLDSDGAFLKLWTAISDGSIGKALEN